MKRNPIKGRGAPSGRTPHKKATSHKRGSSHKRGTSHKRKILNIHANCKWEVAPLPGKRRSYESETA